MDVAIVPARIGKTRLAGMLGPHDRVALQRAMLRDVLEALQASRLGHVIVAAGDDAVVEVARDADVEVLVDGAPAGLNAALTAATAHAVRGHAATSALIVAADLPTLTPDEVDLLLTADADVVIAPTADGGTGGLLRRPPTAIDPSYGPGSAARHLALAAAAGRTSQRLDAPGFALDVDTPGDLAALARATTIGPRTNAVVAGLLATPRRAG